MARFAINGCGRIGRLVMRALREADADMVALNDVADKDTIAHLIRYDSVHGRYPGHVEATDDGVVIDGDRMRVFHERDPADLPWKDLAPDVVIDASGRFRDRAALEAHVRAGADKVLLTAPGDGLDATIVRGVNDDRMPSGPGIVGAASCTTNCLAPIVKVLDDVFGVEEGFMTTIHAATNDQVVGDAPHKDLRRARGTLMSMIPTDTGAARAVGLVLPHLDGRLDGLAVRVPTADVSLLDLTVRLKATPRADDVRQALCDAAKGPMEGILGCEEAPLVSVDFTHDPRSAVVDLPSLRVRGPTLKVLAWYDNEWGYANRVAELALGWAG